LGTILQQSLSVLFFLKKSDREELCLKLPQFIKKYHMIKKLLLLLLIVFVNPIFAQIEQLGIKQRGAATTAFTKETELTIENLMALKPEISWLPLRKNDDNNPVSIGWTLVAGADIEEKR
jgi:hypothetical protein